MLFLIVCSQGPTWSLIVDPGPHVGRNMICGVSFYWPQIKRGGRGFVCCHQFLHFKQTSGHRLYLQSLNSSLMQTGAHMLPLRMSTESTVADSCELRKDECHTRDGSQLQYIHPLARANCIYYFIVYYAILQRKRLHIWFHYIKKNSWSYLTKEYWP